MNFRWVLLLYDGVACDMLGFFVCLNDNLIVWPLQQIFFKMTSHWRRRCLMVLLVPETFHLGQRFQVLDRFSLSDIYLLLNFSSGMSSEILETGLLISHILHCLLEFCLLSGISHWSILQVNIVGHLLKISKLWELSEFWGKGDSDIGNCLCIHILQPSFISLNAIWGSSVLRLHTTLAWLIFEDSQCFNRVFAEDMSDVLFGKHVHKVFGEGLRFGQLFIWWGNGTCWSSPSYRKFGLALHYSRYLWRCIPTSRLALLFLLYSLHDLIVKLSLIRIARWLAMSDFWIIRHDLVRRLKTSICLDYLSDVRFLSLILSNPQRFLKTILCIDAWNICQPLKCQVFSHTYR